LRSIHPLRELSILRPFRTHGRDKSREADESFPT
jgi:hypothetical protein